MAGVPSWRGARVLTPAVPEHEERRLRVLQAQRILDTGREDVFDDLTLVAALATATPVAAITFVDRDREWFKACHGVDLRQADRQVAFCAHAILEPAETLVVEDARRDPRFAENPMVCGDPHIRFYAGVPLVIDRMPLGSICVVDAVPRRLTAEQLAALRGLARVTEGVIGLRRRASA